jgi:hypothetical protein
MAEQHNVLKDTLKELTKEKPVRYSEPPEDLQAD